MHHKYFVWISGRIFKHFWGQVTISCPVFQSSKKEHQSANTANLTDYSDIPIIFRSCNQSQNNFQYIIIFCKVHCSTRARAGRGRGATTAAPPARPAATPHPLPSPAWGVREAEALSAHSQQNQPATTRVVLMLSVRCSLGGQAKLGLPGEMSQESWVHVRCVLGSVKFQSESFATQIASNSGRDNDRARAVLWIQLAVWTCNYSGMALDNEGMDTSIILPPARRQPWSPSRTIFQILRTTKSTRKSRTFSKPIQASIVSTYVSSWCCIWASGPPVAHEDDSSTGIRLKATLDSGGVPCSRPRFPGLSMIIVCTNTILAIQACTTVVPTTFTFSDGFSPNIITAAVRATPAISATSAALALAAGAKIIKFCFVDRTWKDSVVLQPVCVHDWLCFYGSFWSRPPLQLRFGAGEAGGCWPRTCVDGLIGQICVSCFVGWGGGRGSFASLAVVGFWDSLDLQIAREAQWCQY